MTTTGVTSPHESTVVKARAELILGELDQLPALPAAAARLLAVTIDSDSSARDVAAVLESDASLTAAVLRMVRRADRGVRGEAVTVDRAVSLLGYKAVRNAALSFKLHAVFASASDRPESLDLRQELWKHSLAAACAAEAIAEHVAGAQAAGEAFVCGLLHDIGKIALDACLPKSYTRVTRDAQRRKVCVCEVERELFGLDHTVAGKRVTARWRLPASIVECAWLHHQDPDTLSASIVHADLVRIVHAADHLARRLRIGYSGYHDTAELGRLASLVNMEANELEALGRSLPERMAPYCEQVGLNRVTGSTLSAEMLAKANEELGSVNAELSRVNRRLENRSRCFVALDEFTRSLTEHDGVVDVCAAAARALRGMLNADRVVVFAPEEGDRYFPAAWSFAEGAVGGTCLVDSTDEPLREGLALLHGALARDRITAMIREFDDIWKRCTGAAPNRTIWMWPFHHAGRSYGAALFTESSDEDPSCLDSPDDRAALASAVGLAVASARIRVASERMTQELMDTNQRLRKAQAELVRAKSVGMIAEMAGGAAHELGNPLAVIKGRAQLLRSECEDEKTAAALDKIMEQAQRAADMATDLMEFAKPPPPKPQEQNLPAVLEERARHWRTAGGRRASRLIVSFTDAAATVYADSHQLRAILDALLSNALQATSSETGQLQINSTSRASDDTVRIDVVDNGVGMSSYVLERAVDPFFSSRPAGRGRGLGLSRAYRLAEINGGFIRLESTEGAGATATVVLPARAPVHDTPS